MLIKLNNINFYIRKQSTTTIENFVNALTYFQEHDSSNKSFIIDKNK